MKISSLLIDGFGIFRNQTVQDLPDGLVLILGNNESGKSTAVAFIRSMLFGFPDGRSKENPYPPLAGGKHGGRLILSDALGEHYTVERAPGKHGGAVTVILPDGTVGGSETLQQLLGPATKDLFKNIYAFSLEELQTIQSLNNESVRGTIYGASAGTGILSLPAIETEIEKQMKARFSRGHKPEINQLLSQLASNKKEFLKAKSTMDEYDKNVTKLGEIKKTIEIVRKEEVTIATDLKKAESYLTYLTLWDDWVTLCQAEKELSEKEPIAEFPENGLARLDRFIEREDELRSRIDQKNSKIQKLRQELDALPHEDHLLNHKAEIERLLQGRDRYAALVESLPGKHQRREDREKEIEQLLTQLGPGWDEAKVAACDRSLFTREIIHNYAQRFDHAKTEKAHCMASLDSAQKNHTRALHESQDTLIDNISEEEHNLSKRKTAVHKLRALLITQSKLRDEIRHMGDRILDKNQQKEWISSLPPIPALIRSVYAWGLLAVLAILAGVYLVTSDHIILGALTIAIVLIMAGWVWRFDQRRRKKAADYQQRLSKITEDIDNLQRHKEECETSLQEATEQVNNLLTVLGTATLDLDKIGFEIAERERSLEKAKSVQYLKETTEKELEEAKKRLEQCETRERALRTEWKQWLNTMGFSSGLSPQTALDALQIIVAILDRINIRDSLSAEIKEDEYSMDTYVETAHTVLTSCGRDLSPPSELPSAIDRIAADLRIAEKASEQCRMIEKERHETKQEKEDLEKAYTATQESASALLNAGKAKNEEDFRRRGALYENNQRLQEIIIRARNNMLRISGQPDWNSLRPQLLSVDKERLLMSKTELSQCSAELSEELEILRNKRADLEAAIAQMSTADTIARLRAEEERLLEEIHSKAEDWSRFAIAKYLLAEARKKFEQDQQPKVIREASAFFKTITGEKYHKIIAPPGGDSFEVIDNNSHRKGVDALSRGTKEELYLCVRFGYIRNYAAKEQPLPIIMDDILVNFDPPRVRAASRTIYDLSKTHQVLFFTCHPESIAIFHEIDSNIPVLRLENNGFV
jgi:uncharacterized protein YhaN